MLYDPQWDWAQWDWALTSKLTLESFRGFCERQPAGKRYRYPHKHACAVGQWLTAIDQQTRIADHWGDNPLLYAVDRIACESPRTFGALSKRLRRYELIAEVPF